MKELKELTLLVGNEEKKRQIRQVYGSCEGASRCRICRFYFAAQVPYPFL